MALTEKLTAIANAIRSKTGKTESMTMEQMVTEIDSIQAGGGGGGSSASVPWNDVTFIDYDGTVLHSYSLAEAQALTELPPLPTQQGLICQGWNWSLEDIKAQNGPVIVGAMYITDDGKTRIYIALQEGRTSPMLGVCPKGTVTVDWGDGTEPDVLTGTSTSTVVWTPTHEYASAGSYVIRLSVDGEMGMNGDASYGTCLLRFATASSNINFAYQSAIKKVEIGNGVKSIERAFQRCYALSRVTIPNCVTKINRAAFYECSSLLSVVIPNGTTQIEREAFNSCPSIFSVAVPNSVTSFSNTFSSNKLSCFVIPGSVSSTGASMFSSCKILQSATIHDGVKVINTSTFQSCPALASIVIPGSVTEIRGNAFYQCFGVRYYDFSACTSVPTLGATSAFDGIAADCQMLIPAALFDEWSTATNWATYASYMVAV